MIVVGSSEESEMSSHEFNTAISAVCTCISLLPRTFGFSIGKCAQNSIDRDAILRVTMLVSLLPQDVLNENQISLPALVFTEIIQPCHVRCTVAVQKYLEHKELDFYTRERICELKFILKWGARPIQNGGELMARLAVVQA